MIPQRLHIACVLACCHAATLLVWGAGVPAGTRLLGELTVEVLGRWSPLMGGAAIAAAAVCVGAAAIPLLLSRGRLPAASWWRAGLWCAAAASAGYGATAITVSAIFISGIIPEHLMAPSWVALMGQSLVWGPAHLAWGALIADDLGAAHREEPHSVGGAPRDRAVAVSAT